MDHQFIIFFIILLGSLGLAFYIMEYIRKELDEKTTEIKQCIENNTKVIKGKIQADMNLCVHKLKSINGEYIEQVRKMNDYGSQPITNISNHYTDAESNCKENQMRYLSDARNESVSKKKEKNSLYMSDDAPVVTKNAHTPAQQLKKPESQKHADGKYVNILEKIREDLHSNDKHGNVVPNKTNEIAEHIIEADKVIEADKAEENKEEKENKEDEEDEENEEENTENKENPNEENKEDNDTVSTRESSDGIVIEIEHPKTGADGVEAKSNSTHSAIGEPNDIEKIDITNLKPIGKYTVEYLKKIAKQFDIPLVKKDGTTRSQLKKEELYGKIKQFLSNI